MIEYNLTLIVYFLSSLAGVMYAWHARQQHLRVLAGALSMWDIWFHGIFMMITRFLLLLGIGWLAVKYAQATPVLLSVSFVVGYTGMMLRYTRQS